MSALFIVLLMVFFHIVDDYYLQGILASMKQKIWWKSNAPGTLYKYDYVVALVMHAISWSFMIMLPIAINAGFNVGRYFLYAFLLNALLHGIVDDIKANRYKINLIIDQSIHIIQVLITAYIFL